MELKREYRLSAIIALVAVAGLLISQSIISSSAISSSTAHNYSQFSGITECTYLIFKIDTSTAAQNCDSRDISYGGLNDAGSVDGADHDAVIQSTLDAMTSGGKIFIKKESTAYEIDAEIDIPTGNKHIIIESDYAELKRTANIDNIINLNSISGSLLIRGVYFNGNGATVADTNRGVGGSGSNVTITHSIFDGFNTRHPVGISNSENIQLVYNLVGDNAGFGSEGGTDGLVISHNYFFETSNDYPVMAAGNINKNTNVTITDNQIPFGSSTGGGIDVVASGAVIRNNFVKDPFQHGIFVHDNSATGGSDEISKITIEGNTIIGDNGGVGPKALVLQNSDPDTEAEIRVIGNYLDNGSTASRIKYATFIGNHYETGTAYVNNGTNQEYYHNTFHGSTAFNMEAVAIPSDLKIAFNRIESATAFSGGRVPTSSEIVHNDGFVTENEGTGTINNAATAAVITHGLAYTPSAAECTIIWTENPTNDPGNWWLSSISSTQFTVNVRADPGASNLDFSWACRRIG